MRSQLALLRLILTAVLCLAGVARPSVDSRTESTVHSGGAPAHACADTRRVELARLNEKRAHDPADDLATAIDGFGAWRQPVGRRVAACTSRDTTPATAAWRRPQARGPPLA